MAEFCSWHFDTVDTTVDTMIISLQFSIEFDVKGPIWYISIGSNDWVVTNRYIYATLGLSELKISAGVVLFGIIRDDCVYVPSQWEMTLHCNVISHWLGAYTKSSLDYIHMPHVLLCILTYTSRIYLFSLIWSFLFKSHSHLWQVADGTTGFSTCPCGSPSLGLTAANKGK